MRKYGVNVVSLFPWSLGKGGFLRSINIAYRAGFDGLQVLPLRGWRWQYLRGCHEIFIACEDAWNNPSLVRAVKNQFGIGNNAEGVLLDWLLFGKNTLPQSLTPEGCEHEVLKCGHDTGETLVEINPELSEDYSFYLEHCRQGGAVCWDTWHVQRPHRRGGDNGLDWEKLLEELPKEAIKLIHVHPTRSGLREYIQGNDLALNNMLSLLRDKQVEAPVIVEVFPLLSTKYETIRTLQEILNRTKVQLC